jgi:hypothetical protein
MEGLRVSAENAVTNQVATKLFVCSADRPIIILCPMKIRMFSCMLLLVCAAFGCKSSTEPQPSYNYFPLTIGSSWNYLGDVTNTKTIVGDTTVGGKVYSIIQQDKINPMNILNDYLTFRNYFRKEGNIIYILKPDTLGQMKDFIYVSPSVGTSGSYYTITTRGSGEKLITQVVYSNTKVISIDSVNGKPYSNVLVQHNRTEIFQPRTSSIVFEGDYYFADGVGLIDQIVAPSETEELINYTIK